MLPYLIAILCLVLLLLCTIGVFLYASGIFQPVCCEIKKPPLLFEAYTYAYKVHEGPYSEAGYLFTEAYSIDPKCVHCSIRYEKAVEDDGPPIPSVVGSLLPETNAPSRDAFEKAGFKITRLEPIEEALVTSFPHISFLSIRIGASRAYANMQAFILEHNLKVDTFIELYDDQWIHYIGLLKDSEKFKLPPSCESSESSIVVLDDREEADETTEPPVEYEEDSPVVDTLNAEMELPDDTPSSQVKPEAAVEDLDEFETKFEIIPDASVIPQS